MDYPEVIKVLPFRGINNEVLEGKKTKITIFVDRMEYSVKYTESVKVSRSDFEDGHTEDSVMYNEEDGVLNKESITGIVKYIKTSYAETLKPYTINYVDICGVGTTLSFSTETQEERDNLYSKLYEWLYGRD